MTKEKANISAAFTLVCETNANLRHLNIGRKLLIKNHKMVGTARFELATTTPPVWCATRLRYAPIHFYGMKIMVCDSARPNRKQMIFKSDNLTGYDGVTTSEQKMRDRQNAL